MNDMGEARVRYVRMLAALRRWPWTTNDWRIVPTLSTDHRRRGEEQAAVNTPEHLPSPAQHRDHQKPVFDFPIDGLSYQASPVLVSP